MAKRFRGYNACENKDWLTEKFIVEGLSREQIGSLVGCKPSTVNVWLWKHGIVKKRSYSPERLYELHVKQKVSVIRLAEMFNVTHDTIIYQLRVHNIPYTPYQDRVEKFSKFTNEWVSENYTNSNMSIASLALREGVKRSTLAEIIKAYGVPVKHYQDTVPVRLDNLLRMWVYRNLRPKILRKNYRCAYCGRKDSPLEIHHIVTIKQMVLDVLDKQGFSLENDDDIDKVYNFLLTNTPLFKDEKNLLVLCPECHRILHARQSEAKPEREGSTTIEITADGGEQETTVVRE